MNSNRHQIQVTPVVGSKHYYTEELYDGTLLVNPAHVVLAEPCEWVNQNGKHEGTRLHFVNMEPMHITMSLAMWNLFVTENSK